MFHWAWKTMEQPGVKLLLLGAFMALFPFVAPLYLDVLWNKGDVPITIYRAYYGAVKFGDLPGHLMIFIIGCGLILLALLRISHARRQSGRFLP